MRHNERSHTMRGDETPENHPLTTLKGFSTVSEESGELKDHLQAIVG
jgi:hypothetical protein